MILNLKHSQQNAALFPYIQNISVNCARPGDGTPSVHPADPKTSSWPSSPTVQIPLPPHPLTVPSRPGSRSTTEEHRQYLVRSPSRVRHLHVHPFRFSQHPSHQRVQFPRPSDFPYYQFVEIFYQRNLQYDCRWIFNRTKHAEKKLRKSSWTQNFVPVKNDEKWGTNDFTKTFLPIEHQSINQSIDQSIHWTLPHWLSIKQSSNQTILSISQSNNQPSMEELKCDSIIGHGILNFFLYR